MTQKHFLRPILSALLLLLLAAVGNSAWAQTFTIEASHDNSTQVTTFTIRRSGGNLPQQTINYRTVNLSAYAGEHYTAVSGTYTFPEGITTKTVEVSELTPSDNAYKYQNTTQRSYRFEVLDVNGFELAQIVRTYSIGTQFSNAKVSSSVSNLVTMTSSGNFSSGMNSSKYTDVTFTPSSDSVQGSGKTLAGYVLIDDSYDYKRKWATVSTSNIIGNTGASASYLKSIGYKIYATVCFTEKEKDDGYQYLQIVAGAASHSFDGADSNGKINYNHPQNAVYTVCFEFADNSNSEGKVYFPHRGTTSSEFSNSNGKLWQQKYKSGISGSGTGCVVLDPDVSYITTRFDAGGDNDDTWGYKDFFVRMALCDATNPTLYNNSTAGITVSAGPYIKGNTFYVSVPFKEIVTVTGTPTLTNNWGTLSYVSGSGTNVLTFSGTITNNIGSTLQVSGLSGTVTDLAGNSFSWNVGTKTFTGVVSSSTYTLDNYNTVFTGLADEYVLSNNGPLEPVPTTVYFYKGTKTDAHRTTLTQGTHYTLSWSDNTAAGNGTVTATGVAPYTSTASTTFPIRWSTYTVTFHSTDDTYGTHATEDQLFTYNTAQNLSSTLTREGYTIARWTTHADGTGTSYGATQEVNNLTATDGDTIHLYAQWAVIPWTGSGDNADDPYIILYASQLDSLAATVNSGTDYYGKFFKLGANITYPHTTEWDDASSTEDNYTAIGNLNHKFSGTFDGDHKTISGIRIYKPDNNEQGLFGVLWNATLKNINLTDAHIKGSTWNCGGIAGYNWNSSTISGCLVTNTYVNCAFDWKGAIVGKNGNNTLTSNYYRNCIVGDATTNVGVGGSNATADQDGARSVHTLTLPANVTASGESIVIDNVTYYASNTPITLTYSSTPGYTVSYSYNDGSEHAISGNTFSIPAADITVSATLTDRWGVTNTPAADGTAEHPYLISDTTGLNLLARNVNGTHGYTVNKFKDKHFMLANNITYTHTTDWDNSNSTESNYTAIGNSSHPFCGTFDGDGDTISGIRIYKRGTTDAHGYQGLFGLVSGGTIKNLTLTDARITGFNEVGGIAGNISKNDSTHGIIENCHVTGSVTLNSVVDHACWHGGIVGRVNRSSVSGCSSAATLSYVSGLTLFHNYGGIAGELYGDLQNCLVLGANISGTNNVGAVVGINVDRDTDYTVAANYYRGCTVNGTANATNVGLGAQSAVSFTPHDCDGIRSLHTLSLGDGITASNASETKTIGGTTYYASRSTVTLSATVPAGYTFDGFSVTAGTISDSTNSRTLTFTPAGDVSVDTNLTDVWGLTNNPAADGSLTHPYLISDTTGLNLLAKCVNGTGGYTANEFNGKHFLQTANITYDSTENNYTPIGNDSHYFRGHYNGGGNTISGLNLSRNNNNVGLFGYVYSPGTVENVVLANSTIKGFTSVGGIIGYLYGDQYDPDVSNCRVGSDVTIGTTSASAAAHGGIVGTLQCGIISGCISAATVTNNNLNYCQQYGGIVGHISGDVTAVENCLYTGTTVNAWGKEGHIVGYISNSSTLTNNYYEKSNRYGVNGRDCAGARFARKITSNSNLALVGNQTTYSVSGLTAVGTTVLSYNHGSTTTLYSGATQSVSFTYTGQAPTEGYLLTVKYNDVSDHLITPTEGVYSFVMPDRNVIMSAVVEPDMATWWHADDDHDGTSEERAYIITTTTGLNLLASEVNNGNSYRYRYFKLGADISYSYTTEWDDAGSTENNYTAIGTASKVFMGTFDGCGYSVNGIRIYKSGSSSDGYYQGLFGRVDEDGTVKNVTLTNARITGDRFIGGIAGYCEGTIEKCRVFSTSISSSDICGSIVGLPAFTPTLDSNYYHGCTVNGSATDIGADNRDIVDNDGARSVHTLTLGEFISATATATFTYQDTNYYLGGTAVTLSHPEEGFTFGSYTVKDGRNNNVTLTNGNSFTMPSSDVTVTSDIAVIPWGGSGTENDPYIIIYRSQLDLLAERVNSHTGEAQYGYSGKFFKLGADISYPHTTAWDDASSTENNYTAIGTDDYPFRGTFDGDGHTVIGIRIYKGGDNNSDSHQGLFGKTYGTVKNVTLTDARITGYSNVGGIVGNANGGTVQDCRVTATVAIHAVAEGASSHGGIVGENDCTVSGCSSAARLTVADGFRYCNDYGGIVGYNSHNSVIRNCIAMGARVSGSNYVGAIVGYDHSNGTTPSHNYYHGCTVNGSTGSGVGCGNPAGDITANEGAMPCYRLTLPTVVSTGNTAIINHQGQRYVAIGQTVTLVPIYADYTIDGLTYNDGSERIIAGNSFSMPTHDITVTVTWAELPEWSGSGTLDDPWMITTCAELDALAIRVNGGNKYRDKWFKLGADISYAHTTDWNDNTSTENNYTAIGGAVYDSEEDDWETRTFRGTFDGDGHTISGIRIYKGGETVFDKYQGLFGLTEFGYVHSVTLTDTRITGYQSVGGIIGGDMDFSEAVNCHVSSSVAIHAVANGSRWHGGIAGDMGGECNYCTSAATLSVAGGVTGCEYFGGVVGYSTEITQNNLALGVSISGAAERSGAIVGVWNRRLENNYYRNCSYGGATENIGTGNGDKLGDYQHGAGPAQEMSVTIPGYGEGRGGWHFISVPMYGNRAPRQVENLIVEPAANYDLYSFEEGAAGAEWKNYKSHKGLRGKLNDDGSRDAVYCDFFLNNWLGYLYASKETVTLTFLGHPITSDSYNTSASLRYTEGNRFAGWNLIGNPLTVPAYADHPYYRMNAEGDGLEACPTSEPLAVFEGAMVHIARDRENVNFTSTAPSGKSYLNLKLCDREGRQMDNAVVEFGGEHALEKNETLNSQFSSLDAQTSLSIPRDGKCYAVAAVSDTVTKVPMAFEGPAGSYTISHSSNQPIAYCHLIDLLTGADIDLLRESTYGFTHSDETSTVRNRFLLVFSPTADIQSAHHGDFARQDGDQLIVSGTGTLQAYDIMGRELFLRELGSKQTTIPAALFPAAGVYLLRLGDQSQKIVVK